MNYKYLTIKEYNMLLASYKGHLKWGNCKNFLYKLIDGILIHVVVTIPQV